MKILTSTHADSCHMLLLSPTQADVTIFNLCTCLSSNSHEWHTQKPSKPPILVVHPRWLPFPASKLLIQLHPSSNLTLHATFGRQYMRRWVYPRQGLPKERLSLVRVSSIEYRSACSFCAARPVCFSTSVSDLFYVLTCCLLDLPAHKSGSSAHLRLNLLLLTTLVPVPLSPMNIARISAMAGKHHRTSRISPSPV